MPRRTIYLLAGIYTLLMCGVVGITPGAFNPGILIAVANAWFWIGRVSTKSDWPFDPQAADARMKWGRE